MADLGDLIIRDVETPASKDLQERFLQAMYMMERYRCEPVIGDKQSTVMGYTVVGVSDGI